MTSTISSREQAILQTVNDYKEHSIFAWLEYERRVDDPCSVDRKQDNMANADAFHHASLMFYQLEEDIKEILSTEGDLPYEQV